MPAQEIEGCYADFSVGMCMWKCGCPRTLKGEDRVSFQCVYAHAEIFRHLFVCVCALTLWQTVPHVQPVVLAVTLSDQQGVVLEIEGQEGERDVHVGRGNDHVGAFQIVRVFIREPRGLDHAGRAGEIAEAEFRA